MCKKNQKRECCNPRLKLGYTTHPSCAGILMSIVHLHPSAGMTTKSEWDDFIEKNIFLIKGSVCTAIVFF